MADGKIPSTLRSVLKGRQDQKSPWQRWNEYVMMMEQASLPTRWRVNGEREQEEELYLLPPNAPVT